MYLFQVSILLEFAAKHKIDMGCRTSSNFIAHWSDLEVSGTLNRSGHQCSSKFFHMRDKRMFSADYTLYDPQSAGRTYQSLVVPSAPVFNTQSIREAVIREGGTTAVAVGVGVLSSSDGWSSAEVCSYLIFCSMLNLILSCFFATLRSLSSVSSPRSTLECSTEKAPSTGR
jgi:hypothetical protein